MSWSVDHKIGIDEDFFFLGGDSIRAMELVSESRSILESLSFKQIYDGRTPEKIAELVQKCRETENESQKVLSIPLMNLKKRAFL